MACNKVIPIRPSKTQPQTNHTVEGILIKHLRPIYLWGPHHREPDFEQRAQAATDAAFAGIAELSKRGLLE